jgi:hypothetical protein
MAHERQQDFCKKVKAVFPEYFKGVNVCDIGSLDINGNNHYLFEDYAYMGVDVGRGKNVNVVCSGHTFKPIGLNKYDIVISTECFEHDMYWRETISNVCENLLRDGGMFLFTCATTGRPEHGTSRSAPHDSPLTTQLPNDWADYYMNLTQDDIEECIELDKYFKIWRFSTDMESHDLYFWGIKHD